MSTEKMREEFEAAFVEWEVELLGEGFRSSALYMIEENTVNVRSAWWAWQASRAAIEVEIPAPIRIDTWQDELEQRDDGILIYIHDLVDLLEPLGLKIKQ